jgi:uncharacterized protein
MEWDDDKAAENLRKHGVDFARTRDIDWATAQFFTDDRRDYGEERQWARAMIGARLHIVVFVLRGDALRIISLRKANRRERAFYASEI